MITGTLAWLVAVLLQGTAAGFTAELPPGRFLRYAWENSAPELRQVPNESAPIAKALRGVRNRLIEYDSVRYVTTKPGYLVAIRETYLTGRDFGNVQMISRNMYYRGQINTIRLAVAVGDTLLYVQDRADDTCFVQVKAATIEAQPCPAYGSDNWRVVAFPQTELWIRVSALGEPLGWIKTGSGVTKVVDGQRR